MERKETHSPAAESTPNNESPSDTLVVSSPTAAASTQRNGNPNRRQEALTFPQLVEAEGGATTLLRRLDEVNQLTGEYFSEDLEAAYLVHHFDTEAKGRHSLTTFSIIVGVLYIATFMAEAKMATAGHVWPGPSLGLYMVSAGIGCIVTGVLGYVLSVYPAKALASKTQTTDLMTTSQVEMPTEEEEGPRSCLDKTILEMCIWYERLSIISLVITLPVQAFAAEGFMTICYNISVRDGHPTERCTNIIYPWTLCVYVLGPMMLRPRTKALYCIFIANVAARGFGRFAVLHPPVPAQEFFQALCIEFFALCLLAVMFWALDKQSRGLFKSSIEVYLNTTTAKKHQRDLDGVLQHLLPKHALDRLTSGHPVVDSSSQNSVSLCDLYDFEQWSTKVLPITAVRAISTLVSEFDTRLVQAKLHKIKARGDRYLCSTKLREEVAPAMEEGTDGGGKHGATKLGLSMVMIIKFARLQLDTVQLLNRNLDEPLRCRIGLHTGQLFGAIVGTNSVSYDVFGPSVSAVSTMVMQQKADSISASTALLELFTKETNHSVAIRGEKDRRVESAVLFDSDRVSKVTDVIPPAFVVELEPEAPGGGGGGGGISQTALHSTKSIPAFYVVGQVRRLRQTTRPAADNDADGEQPSQLVNPQDIDVIDTQNPELRSPVNEIEGFAALAPIAHEDETESVVSTIANDFDHVAAAQRRSVLIERVHRLKMARVAKSRRSKSSKKNKRSAPSSSSSKNPLTDESASSKSSVSFLLQDGNAEENNVHRHPQGPVWSLLLPTPTTAPEATASTTVDEETPASTTHANSLSSTTESHAPRSASVSIVEPKNTKSVAVPPPPPSDAAEMEAVRAVNELQQAVVDTPDALFAMSKACSSSSFTDSRIEALYTQYIARYQMPRDAFVVSTFVLLLLAALFIFLLVQLRDRYTEGLPAIAIHAFFILLAAIRMLYLRRHCATMLDPHAPTLSRYESLVLLFIMYGMYLAFILAPANITNNSIEYWFIFCGTAQAIGFQRFSYVVTIPITFGSYVLYVLWWIFSQEVAGGNNFVASNLILIGAAVYIVLFALGREQQLRSRFRNTAIAEAQLQCANDEIELQKALLNMIFPSHVVHVVVEKLVLSETEAGRRECSQNLYLKALRDIVAIHIRLDSFTADITRLHKSAAPSDAHSYIEQTLSHVDTVLKAVNDEEFAKAGGHRVLHKINLIGDSLLLAGPIFSADAPSATEDGDEEKKAAAAQPQAPAKSMVHAAALTGNSDDDDDEVATVTDDEALLACSCRGAIAFLTLLQTRPIIAGRSRSEGNSIVSENGSFGLPSNGAGSSANSESGGGSGQKFGSEYSYGGGGGGSTSAIATTNNSLRGPPLRFSAVAVVGSAFATVIGADHASFDVMGVAVRQSAALMNAAPPSFVGVDESFKRAVRNLLLRQTPLLAPASPTSSPGAPAAATDPQDKALQAVMPVGTQVTWRVRGYGVAKMYPLQAARTPTLGADSNSPGGIGGLQAPALVLPLPVIPS